MQKYRFFCAVFFYKIFTIIFSYILGGAFILLLNSIIVCVVWLFLCAIVVGKNIGLRKDRKGRYEKINRKSFGWKSAGGN